MHPNPRPRARSAPHAGTPTASAQPLWRIALTTARRAPLFGDFDLACAAARLLGGEPLVPGIRCLAWVLLPDEAELLLDCEPGVDLERVVRRLKRATAAAVNRERAVSGSVWSRTAAIAPLPDGEPPELAARALVQRPLRAGLVARLGDYPFWNLALARSGETQR